MDLKDRLLNFVKERTSSVQDSNKRRAARLASYLAILVGSSYGVLVASFALEFVRLLMRSDPAVNIWMIAALVIQVSLVVYLVYIGRRALYYSKGKPRPEARFGWGRIVVGACFLFALANDQFHLGGRYFEPAERLKPFYIPQDPAWHTVVDRGLFWIILILWGVARGLRHRPQRDAKKLTAVR
jgi:hypothetical protein